MKKKKKRSLEAEDLYRFELVSDCQISPDGRHVVFCVERVDRKSEKKYTNLWMVRTEGGDPWQFTYGDQSDTHPRWSPDGSRIAFLSNRQKEEQDQVYLLDFRGGEARPLTNLKGEFETFQWSPDGRKLVCQFRKKDQETVERDEDEDKKKLGIVSRHITRIFFKADGTGYLPQDRWHLWIVDVDKGEVGQFTSGEIHDELWPCWSPDGSEIAFLSNRSPDPDLDPDADELFVMPTDGGQMRRIKTPVGFKHHLCYSPDGLWLAYIGRQGGGEWWKNDTLWVAPADGNGPVRNLTGAYDILVGNGTLGDVADRPTATPAWSPDSQKLYFQVSRHGNTTINMVSVDGNQLHPVVGGEGITGMFTLDKTASKLACCFGNRTDIGQIYLQNLESNQFEPLTHFNEEVLREIELGEIEEAWFKGADGGDLQGWIVKPPNFQPDKKYPSILEIHGGPFLQYGNSFIHEFYFLAGQGYVVYFCNPRGSQGYGEEHARIIANNWGSVDYDDAMAWADYMAQQPYIDEEKMGVAGGSYGGFMTGWVIGHTDRFAAAVAQRVVSNLISMWGSSDFNWDLQREFGGKPPWEDLENLWRQSPLAHIGNAKTPTLVIHSEQDMRCELEQGLQLFVALKWLGVETELVLFPEESHGLSRGGRTDRRIVRLNHMLRWFDRFLKS